MDQNQNDQPDQEKPTDALPDITRVDAGEKEPGEDPDFDDTEIEGGHDNRG